MEDYKEYSYRNTLRMLDGWYDHDTEDVNYAHVLLSMSRCDSIKECIKIYKRVYEKYQKYMNSTSQSGHKSFDEDLNACLNENICQYNHKNQVKCGPRVSFFIILDGI